MTRKTVPEPLSIEAAAEVEAHGAQLYRTRSGQAFATRSARRAHRRAMRRAYRDGRSKVS